MIQLDNIPRSSNSPILIVRGSVEPGITRVEYGIDLADMASVDVEANKFKAVLNLTPGNNDFYFIGYTLAGEVATSTRHNVRYQTSTSTIHQLRNALDLHGDTLGFNRMYGELNPNYRTRLLQGAAAVTVEDHIPKSVSTEVAIPYSGEVIRMYGKRSPYGSPRLNNPYVRVTFESIDVASEDMHVEEVVRFRRGYPYIKLSQPLAEIYALQLYTSAGEYVPKVFYEYDVETKRLWIKDLSYADQDLKVKYFTYISFPKSGTIQDLIDAIDLDDRVEVEFTETRFHTLATPAAWIVVRSWRELVTDEQYPAGAFRVQPGNRFSISEVMTFPLHSMRRHLLNEDNNGLGTRLEFYKKQLNTIDRRSWGNFIIGKDLLRDREIEPLYDTFPHVTDNVTGTWGPDELNLHEYLDSELPLVYRGVLNQEWHSGVGSSEDIEPSLVDYDQLNSDEVFDNLKIPTNIIYGVL